MKNFIKILTLGTLAYIIFSKIVSAPYQSEIIIESIKELEKIPEEIIPIKISEEELTTNEMYAELLIPKGGLNETYSDGQCELAAKEFQNIYGGNLVFIAPYNRETTAWKICDFCGHWTNRIYYKGKILWIDYMNKEIYTSKESMRQSLQRNLQFKFEEPIDAKVFVYGEDEMPYSMIWHY